MEAARPATAADLPRVVELARALHAELVPMRGGSLWSVRETRVAPETEAWRAFLARDDTTVVVGTIDGVIVGYAGAEVETLADGRRLGIVGDLYVEPGARAVGVGEALAGLLVSWCEERRCAGIDAFALPGHRDAKNFFERAGFTARALLMHKPLEGEPSDREPPAHERS
jgi:GNAT superfamily N-acetyltransferase